MVPVQAIGIVEHERVQTRLVEALADVTARCEHDARLSTGEQLVGVAPGAHAHAAMQHDELRHAAFEQLGERAELRPALGEDERVATFGQLGDDHDAPHSGLRGMGVGEGVADRSALHGDDRVVAVTAPWCCREAGDVTGGNLAQQPLDGDGGDVVARWHSSTTTWP